jgi:hypothetical protein
VYPCFLSILFVDKDFYIYVFFFTSPPSNEYGKIRVQFVATPLLEKCEDDTHTPEMGI